MWISDKDGKLRNLNHFDTIGFDALKSAIIAVKKGNPDHDFIVLFEQSSEGAPLIHTMNLIAEGLKVSYPDVDAEIVWEDVTSKRMRSAVINFFEKLDDPNKGYSFDEIFDAINANGIFDRADGNDFCGEAITEALTRLAIDGKIRLVESGEPGCYTYYPL